MDLCKQYNAQHSLTIVISSNNYNNFEAFPCECRPHVDLLQHLFRGQSVLKGYNYLCGGENQREDAVLVRFSIAASSFGLRPAEVIKTFQR